MLHANQKDSQIQSVNQSINQNRLI